MTQEGATGKQPQLARFDRMVALIVLAILDSVLARSPATISSSIAARRAGVLRDVLQSHPAPLRDAIFSHRARQVSRELAMLLVNEAGEDASESREMLEVVVRLLSDDVSSQRPLF